MSQGKTFTGQLFLGTSDAAPSIQTGAGAPAGTGIAGDLYLDSTSGQLYVSNGTAWSAVSTSTATIGGTIAAGEVAFGTGADAIGGSASLSYNSGTGDLTVGDSAPHAIRIGPTGYVSNPIIESLQSMNINIAEFTGALGIQTANVDHVLIGGDNGGGQAYLQTQANVLLDAQGPTLLHPATDTVNALSVTNAAATELLGVNTATPTVRLGASLTSGGGEGTSGQVLTSAGSGAAPTWQTPTPGGSAAGAAGEIQYSDGSGGFVASDGLSWDAAYNDFYVYGNPKNADLYLHLESAYGTGNTSGLELNVIDNTNADNQMTATYGRQQATFTWEKQSTAEGYYGTIGFDTLVGVADPDALVIRAFDNQGAYGSYNYWNMAIEARHLNLVIQELQGIPGGAADLQINGNPGTSGQVFTSNGPNVPPTWTTPAAAGITDLTGDVTATGPGSTAATVARIQGTAVAVTAPTNGQVLKYNGTQWAPAADGPSLTATRIGFGSGTNTITGTGNVTVTGGAGSEIITVNTGGVALTFGTGQITAFGAVAGTNDGLQLVTASGRVTGFQNGVRYASTTLAAGSPTAATLRTKALFYYTGAAAGVITLPVMLATDDGLTVKIAMNASASATVTPPVGGNRVMSAYGGSEWVWRNDVATWVCLSNV